MQNDIQHNHNLQNDTQFPKHFLFILLAFSIKLLRIIKSEDKVNKALSKMILKLMTLRVMTALKMSLSKMTIFKMTNTNKSFYSTVFKVDIIKLILKKSPLFE